MRVRRAIAAAASEGLQESKVRPNSAVLLRTLAQGRKLVPPESTGGGEVRAPLLVRAVASAVMAASHRPRCCCGSTCAPECDFVLAFSLRLVTTFIPSHDAMSQGAGAADYHRRTATAPKRSAPPSARARAPKSPIIYVTTVARSAHALDLDVEPAGSMVGVETAPLEAASSSQRPSSAVARPGSPAVVLVSASVDLAGRAPDHFAATKRPSGARPRPMRRSHARAQAWPSTRSCDVAPSCFSAHTEDQALSQLTDEMLTAHSVIGRQLAAEREAVAGTTLGTVCVAAPCDPRAVPTYQRAPPCCSTRCGTRRKGGGDAGGNCKRRVPGPGVDWESWAPAYATRHDAARTASSAAAALVRNQGMCCHCVCMWLRVRVCVCFRACVGARAVVSGSCTYVRVQHFFFCKERAFPDGVPLDQLIRFLRQLMKQAITAARQRLRPSSRARVGWGNVGAAGGQPRRRAFRRCARAASE
jgi:hypothetical protein